MLAKSSLSLSLSLLVLSCSPATTAHAVCVGNGNANTDQPANCPFWANVGFFKNPFGGNFSYLGKNQGGECWCITPRHLFDGGVPAQVHLNGNDYGIDPNSATDLLYMGIDIAFFRLTSDPQLPPLPIAPSQSVSGDVFTLCGQGYRDAFPGLENGQPCWFLTYSIDPPVRWARRGIIASIRMQWTAAGGTIPLTMPVPPPRTIPAALCSATMTTALSAIIIGGHVVDGVNHVDPQTGIDYDLDGYTGARCLAPIRGVIRTITGGLGGALGDTDGDGHVTLQDLVNVKNYYGQLGPGIPGDTDGNGTVDLQDLLNVKNNFGQ